MTSDRSRDGVELPTGKEISIFQRKVLSWYRACGRKFPWRRKRESKYRLIVTELLLQRTRAETIDHYYNAFFLKFPSWNSLANAEIDVIGFTLKPLGLWQRRANTLKKLAQEMASRNGRFPWSRHEIDTLPGVGQYVGNAIELLCHHRQKPLLDEGMARVLERYFGPRKLVDIRYDPYLQALSTKVVKHPKPIEINWSILDLGALVCTRKVPSCQKCPLRKDCTYEPRMI